MRYIHACQLVVVTLQRIISTNHYYVPNLHSSRKMKRISLLSLFLLFAEGKSFGFIFRHHLCVECMGTEYDTVTTCFTFIHNVTKICKYVIHGKLHRNQSPSIAGNCVKLFTSMRTWSYCVKRIIYEKSSDSQL